MDDEHPLRVAIVGAPGWADQAAVKLAVTKLPPGSVVMTDEEPYAVEAAALRQARCSGMVGVAFRQSGNGKRAIEARAERDRAMYALADKVIVFGELPPDREATLASSSVYSRGYTVRYPEDR